MNAEKQKILDNAIKGINKTFGKDTVVTALEAGDALKKRVIKTPSIELNRALFGGFTGIVELFGPERSGKTSLAIETIAVNQKEDPDFVAVWCETEGSVTHDILESHNVDKNRLIYLGQEKLGTAESMMNIVRSLVMSGSVDLIVFNSVSGLIPQTELESELEKQNMALLARLMSKFLRIIVSSAKKTKTTIIFINQLREAVGKMFGNPETTTGGRALRFYADQRIRQSSVKLESSDPVKSGQGMKVHCITHKNRLCIGEDFTTECNYYVIYATGINNILSMPQVLSDKKILRRSGAYYYYEDDNGTVRNIGGFECKWQGAASLIKTLETHPDILDVFNKEFDGIKPDVISDEEKEKIKKESAGDANALEAAGAFEEEEDNEEYKDVDS